MSLDQGLIFGLLALVVVLLIWGRIRYDTVAFGALVLCVLVGLIPASEAFAGFGHPATVTVALVLVLSKALSDSGATDIFARAVQPAIGRTTTHIAALGGIGAVLSGFMNNVGTLGLLMPVALSSAAKAKRAAGLLLMPLSFATILGGLITLIGTPPNIIVATQRAELLPERGSFGMFDFTPVGGAVALAGLVFVTLIGWRLTPRGAAAGTGAAELMRIETYLSEIRVPTQSEASDLTLAELYEKVKDLDVQVVAVLRKDRRIAPVPASLVPNASDRLLIEASPTDLEAFVQRLDVEQGRSGAVGDELLTGGDAIVAEAVIPPNSNLERRTVEQLRLGSRLGLNLLGVAREGRPYRGRLKDFRFAAGDVLLLHGEDERVSDFVARYDLLPLAERGLTYGQRRHAVSLAVLFLLSIVAASLGIVPIYIAFGAALTVMVGTGLVSLRSLYAAIDWPVIVLLGSLIPVGGALQTTGATDTIASAILGLTGGLPSWMVLTLVLVVTMTLSDVLNNAATAVVMAPISVTLAERLGTNPDAFLMAVAIGASCAFLTPIGHQNNALIMGPGGYRFGDYWKMGAPLELLIVAVAIPMIVLIWGL
ncbi:MAG: SLC13 family permease [Kiloniellales bacterium]